MLHQNPLVSDICALAVSATIAFSFLRLFEETAKRALFDQVSSNAFFGFFNYLNFCGDGLADIVGRRFGDKKIPYNRNKSYAGSIAMAAAGFLTSVGYMSYFSWYMEGRLKLVLGFLIVSVVTALVESLPSRFPSLPYWSEVSFFDSKTKL